MIKKISITSFIMAALFSLSMFAHANPSYVPAKATFINGSWIMDCSCTKDCNAQCYINGE